METFDFTSPSYYTSGLQAVIARHVYERPSVWIVLAALFGTIDAKAQLIGIILVFSVMVFGHCIALAERLFSTLNDESCDIRNNYFEGTQDGMWFSLVVMSTVSPVPTSARASHHLHRLLARPKTAIRPASPARVSPGRQVGFGDVVPRSFLGRALATAWMFLRSPAAAPPPLRVPLRERENCV